MTDIVDRPARLAAKVAVVTGAARGIGRAAAVAMAKEGASIAGLDIAGPVSDILDFEPATPADLSETGRQVEAVGGQWMGSVVDQRDIAALRTAVASVLQRFGRIDVLFAQAGIQAFKPIAEMDDHVWSDQIDTNLTGTANVLRVVVPHLIQQGRAGSSSPPPPRAGTAPSTAPPTRPRSGDCSGWSSPLRWSWVSTASRSTPWFRAWSTRR